MGGAASVLLRASVKQRRIGEAGAPDRGAPAVEEQGRAVRNLSVERERGGPGDRRIGRGVPVEAHSEGVVEADARLLDDFWRQRLEAEIGEEMGETGGKGRHDLSPLS
jgi:hypothetical protein